MALETSYPNNCIRGLKNSGDLLEQDRTVRAHVFCFDGTPTKEKDGEKWKEESINWEDDDSAVNFTLNQRKEAGSIKFRAGVAILPREAIDSLNKQPTIRGVLSYERSPLKYNDFHGNLLLKASVHKLTMRSIGASLAMAVQKILPNPNI